MKCTIMQDWANNLCNKDLRLMITQNYNKREIKRKKTEKRLAIFLLVTTIIGIVVGMLVTFWAITNVPMLVGTQIDKSTIHLHEKEMGDRR